MKGLLSTSSRRRKRQGLQAAGRRTALADPDAIPFHPSRLRPDREPHPRQVPSHARARSALRARRLHARPAQCRRPGAQGPGHRLRAGGASRRGADLLAEDLGGCPRSQPSKPSSRSCSTSASSAACQIPQTKRYRYLLGSRQVAAMLGSEDDIYHALGEIEEKDPAVAYDRCVHRRRYAADAGLRTAITEWPYSPADRPPDRADRPGGRTPPVQIVCGLEAAGSLQGRSRSEGTLAQTGHLPGADPTPRHPGGDRQEHSRAPGYRRSQGAAQGWSSIVVFTPRGREGGHEAIVLARAPAARLSAGRSVR